MPDEMASLHLSRFERHVVEQLASIRKDVAEIKCGVKQLLEEPDVTVQVKCCQDNPVPPNPPQRFKIGQVIVPEGQTMSAIKFTGVKSTPASATDVKTNKFVVTVEGYKPYEISVDFAQPVNAQSTVTCDIVIPKGANFHVYDYDVDQDGNPSSPSVAFDGTATDGLAFSKAGSVNLPAGNTVDDSELPPMEPLPVP